MRGFLLALVGLSLPLAAGAEAPYGDPVRGKEIAEACVSCHEGDGRSTGYTLYPRIGGQHFDYLVNALREFKHGQRRQAYAVQMFPTAELLSEQDILDIARYFSEMPW